ncbi:hypothetical protein DUF2798 [Gottschalkia acidurici 9a]|uniref:DUF2798 domain-containing protein n=1 Tax=Gottschalkia acidurici (strain ATCC 7906 / DSM 604 / BCRC 14475 / CIP 104303 / KCTC 5404 / NCIMB 10678 / 9a) TaxID=1128398 RepID=K0B1N9_GOTA9|nr:DUF2798 domain-containing protein [Gottschalkia acidurici]AFS79022.1 hypothetical protein DUF2798 [Gottschalkia acidurici 9a]
MKINKRYSNIVSGFMISVSLSLSISFFITVIKSAPLPIGQFTIIWLKSSLLGFCIGFPLAQLYVPVILKIVDNMTDDKERENG